MVNKLGHLVNKPVMVSIPAILGGAEPRSFRLVGLEPAGLWLEATDLSGTAISTAGLLPAALFVPFTQIAYLLEAPRLPVVAKAKQDKSEAKKSLVAPRKKMRT
jgi:hypothetical protein